MPARLRSLHSRASLPVSGQDHPKRPATGMEWRALVRHRRHPAAIGRRNRRRPRWHRRGSSVGDRLCPVGWHRRTRRGAGGTASNSEPNAVRPGSRIGRLRSSCNARATGGRRVAASQVTWGAADPAGRCDTGLATRHRARRRKPGEYRGLRGAVGGSPAPRHLVCHRRRHLAIPV